MKVLIVLCAVVAVAVGWQHTWMDLQAQAICTASEFKKGWYYAVRIPCGVNKSCQDVCKDQALANQDSQVKKRTPYCIDSLHVYHGKQGGPYKLGPKVHRYEDCTVKGYCGPNFCCCGFY